jgi:hypothetical protein
MAAAIAVVFLARAFASGPRVGRLALLLFALYLVLLSAAWFALTVGH